jgi:GNAT superfamily N-acetyltransferase
MNSASTYELKTPSGAVEWEAYHNIRRKVLFENRGRFGVYNENHPDESHPSNYPLILCHNAAAIGVIRIDINDRQAMFRQVAIREDQQRLGHGRMLLTLAEAFAQRQGCTHIAINVAWDAVGFYQRCGYTIVPSTPTTSKSMAMQKPLARLPTSRRDC